VTTAFLPRATCQDPAGGTDTGPFIALGNNPPYQATQWIAMGDSFAAGPGAGPKVDAACARGANSYPMLLSKEQTLPRNPNPASNGNSTLPQFVLKACT
jgi:hypothetical protein